MLPTHQRHADPPHGADGRFYSSGVSSEPTAKMPDIRQCASCGRILSRWSALYGKFFPNAFAPHVTHGTCANCQQRSLMVALYPRLVQFKGMSPADAKAHIDAMVAAGVADNDAREAWDAARRDAYLAEHPEAERMQALHQRIVALRVQIAQVTREGWNPQAQPRSHGKFAPSDPAAAAEGKAAKLLSKASKASPEMARLKAEETTLKARIAEAKKAHQPVTTNSLDSTLGNMITRPESFKVTGSPVIGKMRNIDDFTSAWHALGGHAESVLHALQNEPTGLLEQLYRATGGESRSDRQDSVTLARLIAEKMDSYFHSDRSPEHRQALHNRLLAQEAVIRESQPLKTSAKTSPATPDRMARLAQMKADLQDLKAKYADLTDHPAQAHLDKAIAATSKSGTKAASKRQTIADVLNNDTLIAIRTGIRQEFNPLAPPDPGFLHSLYGAEQLRDALDRFNTPTLKESYVAHIATGKPPSTRVKLLDALTDWGKQQPVQGTLDPAAYAQVQARQHP